MGDALFSWQMCNYAGPFGPQTHSEAGIRGSSHPLSDSLWLFLCLSAPPFTPSSTPGSLEVAAVV